METHSAVLGKMGTYFKNVWRGDREAEDAETLNPRQLKGEKAGMRVKWCETQLGNVLAVGISRGKECGQWVGTSGADT